MIFPDAIPPACRTTKHLSKKDARPDAANEGQITDLRDIYPGSKQIHRDGDVGVPLVLEFSNYALRAINRAGNLGNSIISDRYPTLLERFFQNLYNHISIIIGSGEDEGLLVTVWIEMFYQLPGQRTVKVLRQNELVEMVNLQLDLVRNVFDISYLPCSRFINRDSLAGVPPDAVIMVLGDMLSFMRPPRLDNTLHRQLGRKRWVEQSYIFLVFIHFQMDRKVSLKVLFYFQEIRE